MQRLGRADSVKDQRPGVFLPPPEDVGWQRLPGRHACPQRRQVAGRLVQISQLRRVQRWHPEVERWPVLFDDVEGHLRRRTLPAQHRSCPGPQREGHGVAQPIGEEQLGRRETHIVFHDPQRGVGVVHAGGYDVPVLVHGPLGPPGGARRIQPEALRVSRGWGWFKDGRCLLQHVGYRTRPLGAHDECGMMFRPGQGTGDLLPILRRVDQPGAT